MYTPPCTYVHTHTCTYAYMHIPSRVIMVGMVSSLTIGNFLAISSESAHQETLLNKCMDAPACWLPSMSSIRMHLHSPNVHILSKGAAARRAAEMIGQNLTRQHVNLIDLTTWSKSLDDGGIDDSCLLACETGVLYRKNVLDRRGNARSSPYLYVQMPNDLQVSGDPVHI